MELSQSDNPQ